MDASEVEELSTGQSPGAHERPARKGISPALIAGVVAVAAILASLSPLQTPFFLVDDPLYVSENETLQNTQLVQFWKFFTTRMNPWEYLPLRDLSYRIEIGLFGLNPAAFRVDNLMMYALSCLAVWLCSMQILKLLNRGNAPPRGHWIAAATTSLFAVHPAHVESVVWISGRKDVLSGMLALFSLWFFARALNRENHRRLLLVGSYLFFACAILSKSTVVPLPAVALLLSLIHASNRPSYGSEVRSKDWQRFAFRSLAPVIPLGLLALGSIALQVFASSVFSGESVDLGGTARDWGTRITLAFKILGELFRIEIWPAKLRLMYDVEAPGATGPALMALGVAAVFLMAIGTWFGVRRRSPAWLGAAISGILMTPFLQILPFMTWSLASERFLYLPLFGAALAAAAVLSKLPPRWGFLATAVIAGILTAGMAERSQQWCSAQTILADSGRLSPTHPIAVRLMIHHIMLSKNRFDEARKAAAKIRVPAERDTLLLYIDGVEALRKYDKARLREIVPRLLPKIPREDSIARHEVANMALEAGLYTEAAQCYRGILRDGFDRAEVHYNLGLVLEHLKHHTEAVKEMRIAIERGYATASVWNNLGIAYRNDGNLDASEKAFNSALKVDPSYWYAAYNLARLRWMRNDHAGAWDALRRAREGAELKGESTEPIDRLERQMKP